MTLRPPPEAEAFAHFNAGRFNSALAAFRGLEKSGRAGPRVECFMGHCLSSLGRRAEAERIWLALSRRQPPHLPAFSALAEAALKIGRPEAAGDWLFRALKIMPAEALPEGPFRNLLSGTAYALFNAGQFARLGGVSAVGADEAMTGSPAWRACLSSLGRRAQARRLWKFIQRR